MRGGFIGLVIIVTSCGGLAQRELDDLDAGLEEDVFIHEEEPPIEDPPDDGGVITNSESGIDVDDGGGGADADDEPEITGWTRTFGGDDQDWPREVVVTRDGSVIVCGTFAETVDFDPGSDEQLRTAEGDRDLFVLMLSSSGDLQWVKTIGLGHTLDVGVSMVMGPEEGVILVGQFAGDVDFDPHDSGEAIRTSHGEHDLFVLSLDRSGELRWVQTFGAAGDDTATDVSLTRGGDILVAGQCEDVVDIDPTAETITSVGSLGESSSFVLTLSSDDGAPLWWDTLAYGGNIRVSSLASLDDGDVISSGRYEDYIEFIDVETGERELHEAGGERDVFVLSVDEDGGVEWSRTFGQTGEDWATNAVVAEEQSLFITGHFEHGLNFGPDLVDDHESMGCWDAFILALDRDGDILWSHAFGGAEWDWGAGIALSSTGILVVGAFSKDVNFDPDGDQRRESKGMWDFFLLSLDRDGRYQWARTWGGRGRDYAEQMAIGPDGSIYLIGNFQGRVNFAPCGTMHDVHFAQGGSDAFVTRLMPNGCYR